MPQSLARNYIHIIFSTKHRQPLIPMRFENEIHRYLAGICDRLECNPVITGGYTDHVHILCLLSKKIPLVNLVGHLKAYSSKWLKTKDVTFQDEYRIFLKKYNVEYDERYVWD